jgi:hypothetical protein
LPNSPLWRARTCRPGNPTRVFQPAGEELWSAVNDFSLWRSILRELAEELRGDAKDYDTRTWPFADQLTRALNTGQARTFCLGIGG